MPAEAVEGNGMRCDPAPAWSGVGKGLVFDFDGLSAVNGLEHGAQVAGVDAPSGAAHRIEVRHLADPGLVLADDAVGDRPQLGQVAGRVRSQEQGLEAVAADIGAGALVVEHVVRGHAEVAVQVGGCLVDRDPEGVHQVATVDMPLPEQPELDELKSSFDPPSNGALHSSQLAPSPPVPKPYSNSFWVVCKG